MGLPIISSWKKGSRHKSIDIHLVEKLEANINRIKKENIKVNFYKKIPKNWKGDVIFFLDYIKFIEDKVGVPIAIISVGPDRNQTIFR